ncbi:MAG TPA: acyltransferase [Castellaniella sp.]|uniref:lysophospholipid acyltransferase family protein n=1 Tax=Castellaniella sp. TaxID=1955812 RepID=UPI002F15CFC9
MKFDKKALLRAALGYFGRCSTPTRLRWGRFLGWLTPRLLRSRAHIVRVNLALCFPDLTPQAREALARRHFHLLAQSFVDRGLCWFGDPARIEDMVELQGGELLKDLVAQDRPVLMLAPHFVALDAAATRIAMYLKETASFYTRQSDPDVDEVVLAGRIRFNRVHMVSRHDGVRELIRLLRKRIPVYYLPDMDFGREGSAFVPFFGVQAATLLSTAHIAKARNAVVIPAITHLDLDTGRYHVKIGPVIDNFPGDDSLEAATARLNTLIEDAIRRDPAQYYWVHRRFKTRPEGEAGFY